ncbi:hypothetical protein KP77_07410 [Jeotgalibacillus alimentarius]|uniref:GAF domain-containing protein n=1 Tax=Jeotgalibacillus alimentarius TaxID=135826 RepID=A0A0C2SB91_9BACL|nr:GAF domain-containing protein [Jeotgalibacillus alimentarius]KIL51229.1 hypothetical protein KP77_07410 [Jeotgalibacillus alimentarius]
MEHFHYESFLEQLRNEFELDVAALAVCLPEENHAIRWKYISGNISENYRRIVLYSGKGTAGLVVKTGKARIIENVKEYYSAGNLYEHPILVSEKIESFAAIPFFKNQRVCAVLLVGSRTAGKMNQVLFQEIFSHLPEKVGSYDTGELIGN